MTFVRLARLDEHWLLAAMLPPLHGAIWGGFGSALSRSLMLAHLGLFLLWQPIWRSDQRLDPKTAAAFIVFAFLFVAWMSGWLVFLWLLVLIGLIGGRVFVDRREQLAYAVTLFVLVGELVIGVTSQAFSVPLPENVERLFHVGLLLTPALLLMIPVPKRPTEQPVDLFHALTAATLTAVLALGGLLVMYRTGESYPVAVLQTLVGIAAFLFGMSWLLTPHPGFSGLGQLWTRYLLNVGSPFEQWLAGLARTARQHTEPEPFLEAAMKQLANIPWVEGCAWSSPAGEGRAGRETRYANPIPGEELSVTLYTRRSPGTTLLLHAKLLSQVIGFFYAAKRAQRMLARQAHLQAIHETGARVTHDIKNLLQSLYMMGTVLQETDPRRAEEAHALVRRQLPHLTHRLQLALDKLKSPGDTSSGVELGSLRVWWRALADRHAADGIEFTGNVAVDRDLPMDFLDSVTENLVENARVKRQAQPHIGVQVTLVDDGEKLCLTVCDTGTPVPPDIAASLFRESVDSKTGLGIGLFQAARQAEGLGYHLTLSRNEPGAVCFELKSN